MIKEDFSYPKERMDKLVVTNSDGSVKAAIWTDNSGSSVCYDFYETAMKKFREDEEDRTDYKCARIKIPKVDYDTIVSAIINVEYTNDQVQAIVSDYLLVQNSVIAISDEKSEEYAADWLKFQELRVHAKEIASLLTTDKTTETEETV